MSRRPLRIVSAVFVGLIGLVAISQFVPYGRDHTNPQVIAEPAWNQPETRSLAVRACFDCHSNETRWPWYSHVAPASWLVQHDVDEGRQTLNFSEWNRTFREAKDAAEVVTNGEMPPRTYLLMHPGARLSQAERTTLAHGLRTTFGGAQGAASEQAD